MLFIGNKEVVENINLFLGKEVILYENLGGLIVKGVLKEAEDIVGYKPGEAFCVENAKIGRSSESVEYTSLEVYYWDEILSKTGLKPADGYKKDCWLVFTDAIMVVKINNHIIELV